MAQIEWFTNSQTRCKFNEQTGTMSIPADLVDESKVLGNVVKVMVGLDRVQQRLIIKYTNNHYKGLNLRRPLKDRNGTAFLISLRFIPECDKLFTAGYYKITRKDDELEIDLSQVYRTKY